MNLRKLTINPLNVNLYSVWLGIQRLQLKMRVSSITSPQRNDVIHFAYKAAIDSF